MTDPAEDESVLRPPAAWRRTALPRRDGWIQPPASAAPLDDAALRAMLAGIREPPPGYGGHRDDQAEGLRAALAVADDAEVARVRALLAEWRERGIVARVVSSFVLPSERAWVEADVDEVLRRGGPDGAVRLLIDAVADADRLAALAAAVPQTAWGHRPFRSMRTPTTVVNALGPAAVGTLVTWLGDERLPERGLREPIRKVLAHLPTDEALDALIGSGRVLGRSVQYHEAAARFPRRTLRLLRARAANERADGHLAAGLLADHVRNHPDLAGEMGLDVPTAPAADVTTTPTDLLPALLVEPPWTRRRRPKPVVIEGLLAPSTRACVWGPGERQRWLDGAPAWKTPEQALARLRGRAGNDRAWPPDHLFLVPTEDALPYLRTPPPWGELRVLRGVAAAHDVAAHDHVVGCVAARAAGVAGAIVPFASTEAADVAFRMLRSRTFRPTGLAWIRRHAQFAAQVAIVDAVGRPGARRTTATTILRLVDAEVGRDVCRSAAATYGAEVVAEVERVLDTDAVDDLPSRIPKLPVWLSVATLPPVRLADGRHELPPPMLEVLVTMVLLSAPGAPYVGLERVRADLDRATLGEFAWAVFEAWRAAGAPTKERWVFELLGALGDDGTVARIMERILRDTSDPRAVGLLDSLAAIGSDSALFGLKQLGEKVRTKRIREGASTRIADVAERLGLAADQLADRLLPDFGLDPDGTTRLDFGPRSFTVGFDELLRPVVTDSDGNRRKDLPKPNAADDPELAAAAVTRFKRLKKDANAAAADQIRRLERAMAENRRFDRSELTDVLMDHPLRLPVVRRLVWVTFDGHSADAACTGSFRIAEDRTFADVDDRTVVLGDDAIVGIAHPIHLGETVGAWAELFADYEVLQPFDQLGRSVFVLPPGADDIATAAEAVGATVASRHFRGLGGRGWLRPEVGDGGMMWRYRRPLGRGAELSVDLDPGVYAGADDAYPEQTLTSVDLSIDGSAASASDLGPVATSEALRELDWLTRQGPQ